MRHDFGRTHGNRAACASHRVWAEARAVRQDVETRLQSLGKAVAQFWFARLWGCKNSHWYRRLRHATQTELRVVGALQHI